MAVPWQEEEPDGKNKAVARQIQGPKQRQGKGKAKAKPCIDMHGYACICIDTVASWAQGASADSDTGRGLPRPFVVKHLNIYIYI